MLDFFLLFCRIHIHNSYFHSNMLNNVSLNRDFHWTKWRVWEEIKLRLNLAWKAWTFRFFSVKFIFFNAGTLAFVHLMPMSDLMLRLNYWSEMLKAFCFWYWCEVLYKCNLLSFSMEKNCFFSYAESLLLNKRPFENDVQHLGGVVLVSDMFIQNNYFCV